MKKIKIYLDDVRSPIDHEWKVVRNYEQFCSIIEDYGFENIEVISLDHDLGNTAMQEYFNNVSPNFTLDYNNITEKTGMDCTKWLVDQWIDGKQLIDVVSANMMGYINNYRMNVHKPQNCVRVTIPHTVDSY
jgi:hypothetical protein